jgi:hypothetical protein
MTDMLKNSGKNRRYAPPKATAMLESLRGLGYSVETALADIVDNSISAGSSMIDVNFDWDGPRSRISILDDGDGMCDAVLEQAMRLGASNPLEQRGYNDLGRFGLGLKTASFSKCRRLTVASKRDGLISCLRWDLDEIAVDSSDEWYMLEGPSDGSEAFFDPLTKQHKGTLVLWENLDRIVASGYIKQNFLDLIDRVEKHFEMVFHRYIEGPNPDLKITINGKLIHAWDPFLMGHVSKPWITPAIKHPSGNVSVECHVLPHKDMLTKKEYETASGPVGWTSQQGFYIYRNKRMLLSGSWLGLGKGRSWHKEEAYRLARIKLDITNAVDLEWNINILKSTARPPVILREWLLRYAEETRFRARKTFAWRGGAGRSTTTKSIAQAWRLEEFSGGTRYRIDRSHPLVSSVIQFNNINADEMEVMLKVLETTVPVQRIWLDTADHKETPRTNFDGESDEKIRSVMLMMFKSLVNNKKMSIEAARNKLLRVEPFHNFPALVLELSEKDLDGDIR